MSSAGLHAAVPTLAALILTLLPGCERERAAPAPRRSSAPAGNMRGLVDWRAHRTSTTSHSYLGTVDALGVFRPDLPEPLDLSPPEKSFALAVASAIDALDPITWDQRGEQNLAVRELVGELLENPGATDPRDLERLAAYARRLELSRGIYDPIGYRKVAPPLPETVLERMLEDFVARGGKLRRLGVDSKSSLERRWPELKRVLYDLKTHPQRTVRSSSDKEDPIALSAGTLYEGLSRRDLEGFKDRLPWMSRVAKREGRVVEIPIRSGQDALPPGLYVAEIQRARPFLRSAGEALPERRAQLQLLDDALRTGDPEAWRRALAEPDRHRLIVVLGPLDSAADPRGKKRELGGALLLKDEALSARAEALAAISAELETRLPWDERFRRKEPAIAGPVVGSVLASGGSLAARLPTGIGLPDSENPARIVLFLPPILLGPETSSPRWFDELVYDPADYADSVRCDRPMWLAQALFAEVVGRMTGRALGGDFRAQLVEHADTIERARLDLVGLNLSLDPKAIELGLVPDERCAELHPLSYAARIRVALAAVPEGRRVEDPELRAGLLIVQYLVARGALEVIKTGAELHVAAGDLGRLKPALSTLLAEIMRIKGEGDYDAAKQLVGQYGTKVPREWREDALRRIQKIDAAPVALFLLPRWSSGPSGPELNRALSLDQRFLLELRAGKEAR